MANAAYFLSDCEPTTYISALQGEETTIELYGTELCDATLQVTVTDPDIASVSEVPVCTPQHSNLQGHGKDRRHNTNPGEPRTSDADLGRNSAGDRQGWR
jgi:hypothetical protein